MRSNPLASQLLCRKSIDKLILDSQDPECALKKTLGPWSLTALGIGAVIGSGIFTVIGTAIAGEQFDTSSILNTPVLDCLIHRLGSDSRIRLLKHGGVRGVCCAHRRLNGLDGNTSVGAMDFACLPAERLAGFFRQYA